MSFEEIFDLLLSNDTNQREVGSIALFDAIDKNLIKHFEGKWRFTYQEADDLSQMSMFKIVQKAHTVTEAKKFAKTYPERSYALDLQQEGCSIKEISSYIDRTPAATKEFLSQCRKKLIPFIKHCLDI